MTEQQLIHEQALGKIDQLDERADVFGLGAILCEILTGQPPYVAKAGMQVYRLASQAKLNDCFARLEADRLRQDLHARLTDPQRVHVLLSDIDPNLAKAHFNLGHVLATKGDLKGSVRHYQKTIDIDIDNDAKAHFNIGHSLTTAREIR